MEMIALVLAVTVLTFGWMGSRRLEILKAKYGSTFKGYLVTTCLCVSATAASAQSIVSIILMAALGVALSLGATFLLTGKLSVQVWLDMLLMGFGKAFRSVFAMLGIVLPVLAVSAEQSRREQEAEYARQEAMRQKEEEIKGEAYRKFGVRGQTNSDNSLWREDSDSEWIPVVER